MSSDIIRCARPELNYMGRFFFINFKNYPKAFDAFPKIYQDLETIAQKYPDIQTVFAPPPLLLAKVVDTISSPVWAQHVDAKTLGAFTGYLPPKASKLAGAAGTFLNHSEHPLDDDDLEESVKMAKEAQLETLIFAATPEGILKVKELSPDYIAYEPPELIGAGVAKGISVATAKPDIIPQAVEAAKPIPLVVGAGIFQPSDIKTSLKLGAVGGLVASAIVTADKPTEVLNQLLSTF